MSEYSLGQIEVEAIRAYEQAFALDGVAENNVFVGKRLQDVSLTFRRSPLELVMSGEPDDITPHFGSDPSLTPTPQDTPRQLRDRALGRAANIIIGQGELELTAGALMVSRWQDLPRGQRRGTLLQMIQPRAIPFMGPLVREALQSTEPDYEPADTMPLSRSWDLLPSVGIPLNGHEPRAFLEELSGWLAKAMQHEIDTRGYGEHLDQPSYPPRHNIFSLHNKLRDVQTRLVSA